MAIVSSLLVSVAMFAASPTLYVAHRGAADLTMPEGSLAAYSNAVANASDIVKLDVHSTKDGVVVMSHDGTLKRTMGRDANIIDLDYADILSNSCFKTEGGFSGLKIVRLDEALAVIRTLPEFWIDFKYYTPEFVEKVMLEFKRAGIDESRIMCATFSYGALKYLKKTYPKVRRVAHIGWNKNEDGTYRLTIVRKKSFATKRDSLDAICAYRDEVGLFGVNMPVLKGQTDPEDADYLRSKGLWVSLWFVQNAKMAAKYRGHADAFVTDYASRVK